jgi:hypothetical protein
VFGLAVLCGFRKGLGESKPMSRGGGSGVEGRGGWATVGHRQRRMLVRLGTSGEGIGIARRSRVSSARSLAAHCWKEATKDAGQPAVGHGTYAILGTIE